MQPFPALLFQPCSTAFIPDPGCITERFDSPRGIVPPISNHTTLLRVQGHPQWLQGGGGAGESPKQLSGIFESPLPPSPACPQHLFSSPHKGKPQDAQLMVLRKSRFGAILRTLDGKFARAAMCRALLSHLE